MLGKFVGFGHGSGEGRWELGQAVLSRIGFLGGAASCCADFHGGGITGIPDTEYEQLFRKRNAFAVTVLDVPPESLDQKFSRFVRLQRGTQTFAQFARKLGVSESTLHRIENGHGSSTLRLVQQILRALRCDYEDAFGDPASQLRAAETPSAIVPVAGAKPATGSYREAGRKKR
jgi:DNA-binding XRE family transcriptional regulator